MDRVESLSQAAAANPNDAGVWLQLGDALLELGAVAPAQHMVDRARACEPATAQHWSSLGTLLLRLGDEPAALDALRAATILDSDDESAALAFVHAAIEHGAADEAEDLLRRATCIRDDATRYHLLARAKEAQGDFQGALECALVGGQEESPSYELVELTAHLARRVGRADVEERSLLLMRQLNPNHTEHVIELADCWARRGRVDLAVQELERIGRRPGMSGREREQVGRRFLELGEPGRARAHLEAAAGVDSSATVRLALARALEQDGELEAAVAQYRAAAERDPELQGVSGRLGPALMQLGRYAEATPALVRALSETPDDPGLREQLTRALLMSGDAATHSAKEGSLTGDLAVFRLEELLEFLGIQRATGKLHLTSAARSGVIRIVQGQLIECRYPGRPSLANVLVARGLVPVERTRTLPREVTDDDARLVEVLLGAGAVDEAPLEVLLRARIEQGILHMLDWADGRARFEPEARSTPPRMGFEHQQILMSVVTRLDEQRR